MLDSDPRVSCYMNRQAQRLDNAVKQWKQIVLTASGREFNSYFQNNPISLEDQLGVRSNIRLK